ARCHVRASLGGGYDCRSRNLAVPNPEKPVDTPQYLLWSDESQVAAALLLPLDRLEQRLEVPLPEAHRAVPLDQLEEERRTVLHRLGEDLQQVAVLVAVHQDAPLLQLLDRHPY